MRYLHLLPAALAALAAADASKESHARTSPDYDLKPFKIDLSHHLPHMFDLIQHTTLPSSPIYPSLGSSAGIDLSILKSLQSEWLRDFNWTKEEAKMNEFNHYTVSIKNFTTHFIHERSSDPINAIPLLLAHGWPGSFLEFLPILRNLTLPRPIMTSSGEEKNVSFHVVVPSLPGFVFSERPNVENWTVHDTGRVWNRLMTEILGYETFAVMGTDFGAPVAFSMYDRYNQTCRASHFVFLPFYPKRPAELAVMNVSLSSLEQEEAERFEEWDTVGNAYLLEQNTKPNTIGLSLYDNPVGQLSWIAEKYVAWSDPRQDTTPSILTHNEILKSVSLYYLSQSFLSSVFIYYDNWKANTGFRYDYTKARTDAPMLFSTYRYNIAFWPEVLVREVAGRLVRNKNHDFGGHFPGLDNPGQLAQDLREIGEFWGK